MAEKGKKGDTNNSCHNNSEGSITTGESGVLTGAEISELELVFPISEKKDDECLKAASCDLRLGKQVIICGQDEIKTIDLEEGDPITIESFGTVIFQTEEKIKLKEHKNIIGRFGLMIGYGLEGLILQVGPQVEPGYDGYLFGRILNTSGRRKTLVRGERFLTIEFSYTSLPEDERFEEQEGDDLKQFLAKQTIDLDRLTEPSVIQSVREDLKEYQKRHKIKKEQNDRWWIKLGVIITASGVFIMVALGVWNLYISHQQNKTYKKLSAVIKSTFDENKGSKIPATIIQEGNGTSNTNKTNSDVVTDSNDVLKMEGNKTGTDSNNNSQEADFDDIGKDKL